MVFGWIYIPLFVSFSYDQQTNEKRRPTVIRGINAAQRARYQRCQAAK